MKQSVNGRSPIRSLSLGPELQDPAGELGFVKWHEFTAIADGEVPAHALTRTYNALWAVNRKYEEVTDRWFKFHPGEPLPQNPKPVEPQLDEQPYLIRKDFGNRADTIIDLDGLYIALRLGKMEQSYGGSGMGKGTIGLVTELMNIQIETQAEV